MIYKRAVLLRIEHFQQRGRRVAAHIHAHLVHFIEQEQGVLHPDLAHVLQYLARHGADIGAAMPADLRFIAHPAQ